MVSICKYCHRNVTKISVKEEEEQFRDFNADFSLKLLQ